ncbi:MAG: glycosyltransferase [Rhodospirillaceae bacterium]|nr:glycosyltransferase [Rhodospirillaceae bacterium]
MTGSKGPAKSIISAVGRSGTTIIHKLLLDIYVDHYGGEFDCLYEPFVWDSAAIGHYPRDAAREAQFGNKDALSEEGIFYHTKLPLFAGSEQQDPTLDGLPAYLKTHTARPLLAKFIRANGRLGYLDQLYPDGRFIITLRNPFDVVNSVITKFSFFGAEFHKNDYPRFCRDVKRLFGVDLPAEHELPAAYRAALWAHFMNLAAVTHAVGKPNYKVIVYEDWAANREAYTKIICDHVGATYKPAYDNATAAPVGRVTKGAPTLTVDEVEAIKPLFEQYLAITAPLAKLSPIDGDKILRKYAAATPRTSTRDERGLGWSPVKLESELFSFNRALRDSANLNRLRIAEVQRLTLASAVPAPTTGLIPISVVVTSYNNAATIKRAVDSVLRQSYPVAEVVVADDGSTDGSQALLHALAAADSRVRVIARERNVGVSANRNAALRDTAQAFISQLDGDDEFHPTKIEREAAALGGRTDTVAFSDTLKLGPEEYWDCLWFAGLSGRDALAAMVSRRASLPRDMLMAKDLFFAAGGYREDISIYEDWGFKIRLTEKARHWLYSGGPGTVYRPGGLSQVNHVKHLHGVLRIICDDAADVIARNGAQVPALQGLFKVMKIDLPPQAFAQVQDLLALKVDVVFDNIRRNLLDKPASAYDGQEQVFMERLERAVSIVGTMLVAKA